ncbi:MAG: histidine phosphatase family protein [Planctomycetota bacterium]|nr:histidine phosphatase family protein [Planctomycetota bacterium]
MAEKRSYITLTLIRCGQTRWEGEGRMLGSADLPLGPVGHTSVNHDATRWSGAALGTVHHPPDEAARETARAFARAAKAKSKVLEELADPNLGLLEGLKEREFADRHAKRYRQWEDDPLALIPPEGEPIAEARARLFLAVSRLLKRTRVGEVTLVLHPIGLGLLRCWLVDRPTARLRDAITEAPPVERYTIAPVLIDRLREAAAAEPVSS